MSEVNCLEFRRAVGADPTHASPESLAHRAACATCEKYAQDMLRLNGMIKRALEIPVPTIGEFIVPPVVAPLVVAPKFISPRTTRWYAMAASMLLMCGLIGAIGWLIYPRESLATEAIGHMKGELQSMQISNDRVAANLLDGVLRAKGLHLTQQLDGVSYLQNCLFHGNFVPHLVIQTVRGPVTVLILPQEKISSVQHFDAPPYHGILAPMLKGGIAVISEDASIVTNVSDKVHAAIAVN